MIFIKCMLASLISLSSISAVALKNLPSVDFDKSMGGGSVDFKNKFSSRENKALLDKVRALFKREYNNSPVPFNKQAIPRIIHQVWVGGKPVPLKFKKLIESWKKIHPDWQYILWTDEKAHSFKMHNREFYDKTQDPIEKANILRYEVLLAYGGLYVDIDFMCYRSFNALNERYDFYTGICPSDCIAMLNNALIACPPNHPIIKHCVETIKDDFHKPNRFERTGVNHYSRSFFSILPQVAQRVIALPPTFFYPLGRDEERVVRKEHIHSETFAIHYWASTPSAQQRK